MRKNKQGFTLIELLLGITISVMIFIAASSMLALLFRSDLKTKYIEEIQQAKNDIQIQLTNNLRWSENITFSNPNQTIQADAIKFHVKDGRLYKDDSPLTPSSVKIVKMEILNSSLSSDLASLEVKIDIEHNQNVSIKDNLKVVISQRKTTFEEK